jgi:hypothetical protein
MGSALLKEDEAQATNLVIAGASEAIQPWSEIWIASSPLARRGRA